MAERVRFTISVEPDVHAAFLEMAEVSGQSLSKCVGDWLRDTTEAGRFVSYKMRELRMAPAQAMAELAKVQEKAARETRGIADGLQSGRLRVRTEVDARSAAAAGRTGRPPSSNTGVNPRENPKRRPA